MPPTLSREDANSTTEETFVNAEGERVPDHGMNAVDPVKAPPEGEEDSGMQAVAPLEGKDLSEESREPQNAPPIPSEGSMSGAPLFSADASLPPGPEKSSTPPPLPDTEPPPNPTVVTKLVSMQELENLWKHIGEIENLIKEKVNNLDMAREMFDELMAARAYLMAGRDHYEEAKRYVDEVEYRITLLQRVQEASRTVGWRLFWYEIAALALLTAGLFGLPYLVHKYAPLLGYKETANAALESVLWLVNGVKSTLWGGLGGVTGALYALWRHVARDQDFDPQYRMWYYTNPIMGVVLGAFIYLAMEAGIISMTSVQQSGQIAAAPIFVLAWLSGFQQNVAYDIVRRLLKVFQVAENSKSKSSASGRGSKMASS